jgi:serine/threonine protein phosphatase 1
MTGTPSITRLRGSGRIWALGALLGDDGALERLAHVVLGHWQSGDELVVLGNMLGPNGDPVRTLDLLLTLRRRLMAANLACGVFFLRGAQEEMWHKLLRLQFAMTPLDVLDWMLERGMTATIEAYGASVAEGRIACRGRASAIARWTSGLRELQAVHAGHTDLLNALQRAVLDANGAALLSAAGIDATRPLADQADAFWWNGQGDAALEAALARSGDDEWRHITRLVRGTGPMGGDTRDEGRVLTVTRDKPALAVLDAGGALLERIEA